MTHLIEYSIINLLDIFLLAETLILSIRVLLYSGSGTHTRISIDLHFSSMHFVMKHMFTLFGQSASVTHSISFSILIYTVIKKNNVTKIDIIKNCVWINYEVRN
jgi:hypothetical protein